MTEFRGSFDPLSRSRSDDDAPDAPAGSAGDTDAPESKGPLASLPPPPPVSVPPPRSASGRGEGGSSPGGDGESIIRQLRRVLATAVMTVAVLAACVLALGAVLLALSANQDNTVVSTILDLATSIDGPFTDVFTFDDAGRQALVNWGIAAVVYLIAGRIIERVIRP